MHNFHFGIGYLKMLLEGIDADKTTHQPYPGANHPVWIVGHIADSMGFGAQLAGVDYKAPDGYGALFGMNSSPEDAAAKYPDLAAVLAELDRAVGIIGPALEAVTDEQLAAEMPDEGFRKMMPTVGDGLTFLVNGHITTHVGQLSAWRRACGMPPLF